MTTWPIEAAEDYLLTYLVDLMEFFIRSFLKKNS